MKTKDKVFYSDFGAVGDGIANDFAAIKAAHAYANENNLPVFADQGATYYIGKTGGEIAFVKTDTDWTGANFIIDDRDVFPNDPERRAAIFQIMPDYEEITINATDDTPAGAAIRAINATAKDNDGVIFKMDDCPTIDLGLGYPAMLILYNKNVKQYIRYGGNADNGQDQHEVVLVDKNGKVDPSTAILHDYKELTHIIVKRLDDKQITLKGGVFTTRANCAPEQYAYYSRCIRIHRPNLKVVGVKHYITDEGEHGNPYIAFLHIVTTGNIVVEDCVLTAHRTYDCMSTAWVTPQGSYDIRLENSCNVLIHNVTQSNFFHSTEDGTPEGLITLAKNARGFYNWGIMCSNYCKNLTYDHCKLTRFDAHCGTYNPTIRNSEVGMLSIIGGGKFELINSTVYMKENCLFLLRNDYGSTFSGDVIIKDVTFKSLHEGEDFYIAKTFHYNHFFGYKCYMPQNITIDNLVIESPSETKKVNIYFGQGTTINDIHKDILNGEKNVNPVVPTQKVFIKNNKEGYEFVHPKPLSNVFENLEFVYE